MLDLSKEEKNNKVLIEKKLELLTLGKGKIPHDQERGRILKCYKE